MPSENKSEFVCVRTSKDSTITTLSRGRQLRRPAKKLFAVSDIEAGERLAWFFPAKLLVSPYVTYEPKDAAVDLICGGSYRNFDENWLKNAWYQADHLQMYNAKLVADKIEGQYAVTLRSSRKIMKYEEVGHRYEHPDPSWPQLEHPLYRNTVLE